MSSKPGIVFPGVQQSFQNNTATVLEDVAELRTIKSTKIVQLPIEDVVENEYEAVCYDVKDLDALARDIAENGVKNPLHVMSRDDDKFVVIGGHRRRRAMILAIEQYGYTGAKTLPCIIENRPVRGREFEATERMILDNLQRDKSDYERMMEVVTFKRCVEARRQLGEKIPSARERVKERLGVSDTMITRYEKIHSCLVPELMNDFHDGRIASTVCYDLANMDEVYQHEINQRWDRSDGQPLTISLVNAILASATSREPAVKENKTTPSRNKIVPPKSINEGVTMLNDAIGNVTRVLNLDIKVDNSTRKRILKKIAKQMEQIRAFQTELEMLGFTEDERVTEDE